ncbi:hypothetical protein [truncated ORF], partial [Aspergillus niger]|uniref:Uncharacterized protein n=2 Tax=Aspergillus niger TaxID=5061 RepID=A0AAJ8E0A0_ASPNG
GLPGDADGEEGRSGDLDAVPEAKGIAQCRGQCEGGLPPLGEGGTRYGEASVPVGTVHGAGGVYEGAVGDGAGDADDGEYAADCAGAGAVGGGVYGRWDGGEGAGDVSGGVEEGTTNRRRGGWGRGVGDGAAYAIREISVSGRVWKEESRYRV